MNAQNSVSVVIPCTDRLAGLERCIVSALNQECSADIEILLIENNSKDRLAVARLVEKFNDARIKHFYLERCSNANVARNFGAKQAKGRYVAYLDSDDEWLSNHVHVCLELCNRTGAKAVFSGFLLNNGFNIKEHRSRAIEKKESAYSFLFGPEHNVAQTSSFFLNKEVFDSCQWDERLKRNQDYDFFISVHSVHSWAYLGCLTSIVHWAQGEIRTYSLESFKYFYQKHSVFMKDQDRALYLLEVLKALATCSQDGFDFFKSIMIDYRKDVGFLDSCFTYNRTLSRVLLIVRDVVKALI